MLRTILRCATRWAHPAALLPAFLIFAGMAIANQSNTWSPTTGTVSGLQLTTNYNNGFSAILSSNSGATAPANDQSLASVQGQFWLDTSTTPLTLRYYDGTTWTVAAYVDTTAHTWISALGAGSGTIASATTTDIGSVRNPATTITGTAAITSFGTTALPGSIKLLTFSGALTLTNNGTSLILPNGGNNVTTAAGDTAIAVALGGGNWRVVNYQSASGNALAAGSAFTGAVFFDGVISPTVAGNTNNWNPSGLSTANVVRVTCSGAFSVTGIVAPATDGQVLVINNIGATNNCVLTAQDASSTAANRFAFDRPLSIKPGRTLTVKYDLTTARWVLWQEVTPTPYQGGFKNLRTYNVSTYFGDTAPSAPNSQMKISLDEIALEDANSGGFKIAGGGTVTDATGTNTVSSYVCEIDVTTNGAGGLDTGSVSAGNWYSEWVIANPNAGGTWSCLASLSATAPTMPSGYTFKARVGWNRYLTANAVTGFQRLIQVGRRAQYVVAASTPYPNLPQAATGSAGSISVPTWVSVSISNFVPTTAASVNAVLYCTCAAADGVMAAPNNSYGALPSTNPSPLAFLNNIGISSISYSSTGNFGLESSNIFWASRDATGILAVAGWEDNI